MNLREKIQQDLNIAAKQKEEVKILVLRSLNAFILNKEKEKRFKLTKENQELKEEELKKESQLTEEELIEVVVGEVKKRKESIPEFEKGGRKDLIEKEQKELDILMNYLPEQLSEEEVKKIVKEAVVKIGAKEIKDMGKVMAEIMPQVKGKADGNLVSKAVKELLTA